MTNSIEPVADQRLGAGLGRCKLRIDVLVAQGVSNSLGLMPLFEPYWLA